MNSAAGACWSVTEAAPGRTTNGALSAIRRRTGAKRTDLSISRQLAAELGNAISVVPTAFPNSVTFWKQWMECASQIYQEFPGEMCEEDFRLYRGRQDGEF